MRVLAHARRYTPALVWLGVISALTLLPTGGGWRDRNPFCVLCGDRDTTDILLNVALFVPFGAALAHARCRASDAFMLSLVCSGLIEAIQATIPSRDPTVRDILTNATGGFAGALAFVHLPEWLAAGAGWWRRATTAALLPGIVVAITGALLTPVVQEGPYFAHWRPRMGAFRPWRGEVTAASLGGAALPSGRLRDADAIMSALVSSAPLTLDVELGAEPPRLGSIFGLVNDVGRWQLLLAQDGEDLVLRTRRRSTSLRFETPTARFDGALAGLDGGTPVRIVLDGVSTDAPCVRVASVHQCATRFGVGSAWSLLRWEPRAGTRARRALDLITLCCLALPLGALLSVARAREALVLVAGMAVAIAVAAVATGLAAPSLQEWAALAAGIGLGRLPARQGREIVLATRTAR